MNIVILNSHATRDPDGENRKLGHVDAKTIYLEVFPIKLKLIFNNRNNRMEWNKWRNRRDRIEKIRIRELYIYKIYF